MRIKLEGVACAGRREERIRMSPADRYNDSRLVYARGRCQPLGDDTVGKGTVIASVLHIDWNAVVEVGKLNLFLRGRTTTPMRLVTRSGGGQCTSSGGACDDGDGKSIHCGEDGSDSAQAGDTVSKCRIGEQGNAEGEGGGGNSNEVDTECMGGRSGEFIAARLSSTAVPNCRAFWPCAWS
ncbi:hypothetical protein BC835DRAFT_1304892 [Cytidiella melzeri]|nr:hypothetical protein BC835DRAFT_1304892 [Cytidiella melzeri]